MIAYFGRDERGHYMDSEDGARLYVDEATWMAFVHASARPAPQNGDRLRLLITEHAVLDKFEGDLTDLPSDPTTHPAHVERIVLTPETTEI